MSLDKDTIKTEVARRLARSASDVNDYEVRAALQLITMKVPILGLEATVSTASGTRSYDLRDLPAHFKRPIAINIEGGTNECTLGKLGSFEQYQDLIIDETSADYDEPDSFIIWNDLLYLYPTPDAAYTLRLFVDVFERNEENIVLPDQFEECLISETCFQLLKNKGMARSEEALGHREQSLMWMNEFNINQSEKQPVTNIQYQDI